MLILNLEPQSARLGTLNKQIQTPKPLNPKISGYGKRVLFSSETREQVREGRQAANLGVLKGLGVRV